MKNGNVMLFLKNYWFILAFIVAVAMGWANLERGVSFNTEVNAEQTVFIDDLELEAQVAQVQYATDITFIKTTLERLINEK